MNRNIIFLFSSVDHDDHGDDDDNRPSFRSGVVDVEGRSSVRDTLSPQVTASRGEDHLVCLSHIM